MARDAVFNQQWANMSFEVIERRFIHLLCTQPGGAWQSGEQQNCGRESKHWRVGLTGDAGASVGETLSLLHALLLDDNKSVVFDVVLIFPAAGQHRQLHIVRLDDSVHELVQILRIPAVFRLKQAYRVVDLHL